MTLKIFSEKFVKFQNITKNRTILNDFFLKLQGFVVYIYSGTSLDLIGEVPVQNNLMDCNRL